MNLLEIHPVITKVSKKLNLTSQPNSSFADRPNYVSGLIELRDTIRQLDEIPFLGHQLNELYNSWIFKTSADALFVSETDKNNFIALLNLTRTKLELLREIVEDSHLFGKEDLLYIKLPELDNFEQLARTSTELKKAIEIPIVENSINGNVKILGGDEGSIILYVSVGTILAVKLIAGICWAAAIIRKKNAEVKIFEAHARTLDLKNDALKILIDAQEQQMKNLLQSEAEALATKHYSHNEPEAVERLKLSISSVADLVERGAKILPMNNDVDIQKSFPDYNALNLLESGIKKLNEKK